MPTAAPSAPPPTSTHEAVLLQEIDLLLREPDPPHPEAEKYFKNMSLPECRYAFWTIHAQACVTGARRSRMPDTAIADESVAWTWGPRLDIADANRRAPLSR